MGLRNKVYNFLIKLMYLFMQNRCIYDDVVFPQESVFKIIQTGGILTRQDLRLQTI